MKTTSVRVSFIQIMQIRVQNKSKRVWKSRYVGDVSESCSMNRGLGSKRKRGKVVDTGYPTGLLVKTAKKAWWMAKGGGKWTCLLVEKGKKVRGVGG